MQPINYLAQVPQPDLSKSILGGLQAGTSIRQSIDQQAAQEKEQRLQQSYTADMQAYAQKPTAQGAAQLALKYPKQAEAIGGYFKTLDSERQKSEIQFGNQVYGALTGGRSDIATQLLERRVEALKNSGQDYQDEQVYLDQLKNDPQKGGQAVMAMLGYGMAALDPKFAETHAKFGSERRADELQPAAVAKAGADAQTAIVGARFAESKAVADLQLNEAQIKKMAADTEISRMNARIAAMNAATNREANDLKRQELQLKLSDAVRERDDKLRAKVADVESARSTIDNFLNTSDRLLKSKALNDVVGPVEGSDFYPTTIAGMLSPPVITSGSDERADAIALIETLGSQVFLAQVRQAGSMTGLTEKEGDKLQSALQNLGRKQSEAQFRTNLKEAQRQMLKARQNLVQKFGVPDTIPDRPALPAKAVPGMPKGFEVLGKE
jgi:hypothetical protein